MIEQTPFSHVAFGLLHRASRVHLGPKRDPLGTQTRHFWDLTRT